MKKILLSLFVFLLFPALLGADSKSAGAPVLVLGDSLSAAYRISPEAGWVTLLQQRVGKTRPVVNASISGETTAGGLARLPGLLAQHKPGLVLIELGANDGLRGLALKEIRANLLRLIQLSQAASAKVLLIGIELPVNYGPQYRDGLRNLYRDLASEFKLPLVPFLLDGIALDATLMQDDGLHPTAAAQPKVLENVWPTLNAALLAR
jgi:acyl-CoA thioesterase I